ncbi:MAG: dihydrodipicolinate synthase family protein [Bacteroidia bacterium]|nr:dihydrodipicolinate synthase family protein [Bacteroidia bacterium]
MTRMYGVTTAMVTPFDTEGKVDEKTLRSYTEYLVEQGVHCLYPCGTTGEMLKMSSEERKLVAQTVVDQVAGRIPVFIHVGAMTTVQTIELALHAKEIGAAGVGVVTPQYFGVTDREMIEFYVTVSKALDDDFAVYLYNIPQCAANDLTPQVIERILERTKNVVGVKYSFADFIRLKDYLACNNGNFDVVFGPDRLLLPAMAMGCVGTVSGCSNCGPQPFVQVYERFMQGDLDGAREAQGRATRLCEITKNGANMAIFKAAMEFNGLPASHMRAPALDLTVDEREELFAALEVYRLDDGHPLS